MLGIIDATAGQALGGWGRWTCVTLRSLCKVALILHDNGWERRGVGKIRNKAWNRKGWHLLGAVWVGAPGM